MSSFDSLIFKNMSEHYESLLESGNLSDVVLVAGGEEIKVHKQVLAARSPVYSAMFFHSTTKEAQQNRVEIIDVDVEVLKLLVRYIYTGKVEISNVYTSDLLIAADKYQLDCLKSICQHRLLCQIDIESVSDLFIFADMYHATELNTVDLALECLDFIIDNGPQVMATEGWKKIVVRADLMGKIFEYLYVKYSAFVYVDDKKAEESKKEDGDMDCALGPDLDFEKYLFKYSNVINCKEEATDVVLLVGDAELKVHKLILSNRSPVFAEMFAHDSPKEAPKNRVEITDVDVEVVKLLIMYIYSDKFEGLDRYVEKLFVAANKYQLDCLKSICEQRLLSQINTESVSNLFIFADIHQSTELTSKCVEYIIDYGTEVMQQEDWKKIVARADLVAKLFECLNKKYKKVIEDMDRFNHTDYSDNDYDYEYNDDFAYYYL